MYTSGQNTMFQPYQTQIPCKDKVTRKLSENCMWKKFGVDVFALAQPYPIHVLIIYTIISKSTKFFQTSQTFQVFSLLARHMYSWHGPPHMTTRVKLYLRL